MYGTVVPRGRGRGGGGGRGDRWVLAHTEQSRTPERQFNPHCSLRPRRLLLPGSRPQEEQERPLGGAGGRQQAAVRGGGGGLRVAR
eukprot:346981-Prorocentrum_minimum.AAC.1